MLTIAYVGLPAHGHTNPTLPVMQELVRRGHRILYYNADAFRSKVEPTGVDFRALPEPLPTEREIAESMHHFVNAALIIARMSRHLTHFLIDEFARERPDLVIYDSVAMWGYVAARTHGIAQLSFITTFVLDGSQRAIGLGTLLRFFAAALPKIPTLLRWRRDMAQDFGKENVGGITEYAEANIIFTSQEFHPANSFIDERFHFVGPSIDATTRDGDFPWEQLRDGHRVYISLGTINHLNEAFYRTVFAAFADHPAQFILSVGKTTDIAALGEIPPNFVVRAYVPQLEVLQQVDLFITHGGMNSVHEGLYYNVPQIVIPSHWEQLLNGKRVAETGAGLLLAGNGSYGKVSSEALRAGLEEVLGDADYRRNAARIGETLRAAGGYQRVAEVIVGYIEEQKASGQA